MQQPGLTRREAIRWIVSSFALTPAVASANATLPRPWDNAVPAARSGLLFRDHLPTTAQQLACQSAAGVYAAIYEVSERESDLSWSAERWLCVAHEVEPGRFAVQTSQEALIGTSNWQPVEASLTLSDDGSVSVFEEGLRWHSNQTWKLSEGRWSLVSRDSMGVTGGGEMYGECYDQLRQEVVLSRGRIDEDWPLAITRRTATDTIALTDYSRGPLV